MKRALVTIFVLLLAAVPVAACSCGEVPLEQAVAATEAVFVGRVVRLEVTETKNGVDVIRATVEVEEIVKGRPARVVEFVTDNGCCYCSFGFEIAERYLLFASERGGEYSTSICSRSAKLGGAAEDLEALGLGRLLTRR